MLQITRLKASTRFREFRLFFFALSSLFFAPITGQAQTFLGPFTSSAIENSGITLTAGASSVRLRFVSPDVLRIDLLPAPTSIPDSSFAVIQNPDSLVGFSISESDSMLQVATSGMTIQCSKSPLRISILDAHGSVLVSEPVSGGVATNGTERWSRFTVRPDEHFYGTGERGTPLEKRGFAFDTENRQAYGYNAPLATMKVNVPFIASTRGYAVLFDNTYPGRFDVAASDPHLLTYKAYGGELTLYVIAAPGIPRLLEHYTWLTGHQPLPPRWALGFLQSKFGYRNEAEARAVVQTMRQKQIPCDAIILDLYWFDKMGDISWKSSAWPNPFGMMADLLSTGIKTIAITEPYIIAPSINFQHAATNGYLATKSSGQPYLIPNWWSCGCNAALLDLTKPEARAWWWSLHPSFLGSQMAGLWTDLGEPENHPSGMIHHLGSAAKVHNIYNLLWAKTIDDGFRQYRPNERLFNLTRSGFAGIQRHGVFTWSGDVSKTYAGLAVQMPMMLSMGMSGLAYHHSDIGGFCCGTTSPELYVRWLQFGAFSPIMRAHGADQATEPWAFGPDAETIARDFIRLRYRLLPYNYTLAYENSAHGLPLARPLIFSYPNEGQFANVSDPYLWGNAILVSPITEPGQVWKTVMLPPGRWIDYWSDTPYAGGTSVTVETIPDRIPLFMKAGSIIPTQPVMNFSDERPLDTLTLEIYPHDSEDGSFTLYEDDGRTRAYESGAYATTAFTITSLPAEGSLALELEIGRTNGSYAGKPDRRTYLSEFHQIASSPSTVTLNDVPLTHSLSVDSLRLSEAGFFYDGVARMLYVHTRTDPDSAYRIRVEGVTLSTGVPSSGLPSQYHLAQNYPNPFNAQTVIAYTVGEGQPASIISIRVFDVLGREVALLAEEQRSPGTYHVRWNASGMPSGLYLCQMTVGSGTAAASVPHSIKMLLVK